MRFKTPLLLGLVSALALSACIPDAVANTASATAAPLAQKDAIYGREAGLSGVRERLPRDEIIYFVLPDRFANGDSSNDRGGITGDRLDHGYDPSHKGFYHGGDLKGLTAKLDYLEGMGITAIWFAPIFKNKPVQGPNGDESSGYHGYWVTDFTQVDPHFGTNAEFKAFVDAAHARGMKVYMDIITNHTADVIKYREGFDYRSKADFPYSRRGGPDGVPINDGFKGDHVMTADNFAKLTDPNYAYTVFVPDAEKDVKVPAWLNDPKYYHNRGDSFWAGESNRYGDFVGLDDLFTEPPRVVDGMIDIYAGWIEEFGIDGYRIDTAKHVNPEFWQKFVPAMQAKAEAKGIPNFAIFGEVFISENDPGFLAAFTHRDGFPQLLDFAFTATVHAVLGKDKGTSQLTKWSDGDVLYKGGVMSALDLPTFNGNHDMGRLSTIIRDARPGISDEELLARVKLGTEMTFLLRGVPTVYYGDEQGFVGDGNDQAAREDMFPSMTASYNDNRLIGTSKTTADDNFDTNHPLYQTIAMLSSLRKEHPALRRSPMVLRHDAEAPGIFAVSRFDPVTGAEYLIAFNTSTTGWTGQVSVDPTSGAFRPLYGQCPANAGAPGSLRITIPALSTVVCRADRS